MLIVSSCLRRKGVSDCKVRSLMSEYVYGELGETGPEVQDESLRHEKCKLFSYKSKEVETGHTCNPS
jgi:hypothetical protein